MTQLHPIATLNAVPAREVCDLAGAPPSYRQAFRPRGTFGQSSLLDQPREQTEIDLKYASERAAMSSLRALVIGLTAIAIACVGAAVYVVATGRY